MRTPTHLVFSLAVLGGRARGGPRAKALIALGAVLPDAPIFALYLHSRFVRGDSWRQTWTERYFDPAWQAAVDTLHSFPLLLAALAAAYALRWRPAALLAGSMLLHALLDFPVHRDDAHRHFFPFSDYRFMSPVSYWDRRHHGGIVTPLELLLTLGLTTYGVRLVRSRLARVAVASAGVLYVVRFAVFYYGR